MKKYSIILVVLLQSFVAAVFSQSTKDRFQITTDKNTIWFKDVNMDNYAGFPIKNKNGETIGNPSSKFCSIEKLKKIEQDLYNEEEQNYLFTKYKPKAIVVVRANDGKIVSVAFVFNNLVDWAIIDTKKLRKLQERIMAEITYEDLLFNGQKAVSGYMLASIWFFKN
jgi:hypothetical protein